ncbi:unnamed protein product, partial [Ectocarpus sp. 6 AP-2014]
SHPCGAWTARRTGVLQPWGERANWSHSAGAGKARSAPRAEPLRDGNQLSGPIPPELGNLAALRSSPFRVTSSAAWLRQTKTDGCQHGNQPPRLRDPCGTFLSWRMLQSTTCAASEPCKRRDTEGPQRTRGT